MTLIGLGGYARVGKDALADMLVECGTWRKHYMSEPLEAALLALDPHILVEQDTQYSNGIIFQGAPLYSYLHERMGYDESKTIPDVRRMLQRLGTEVGRKLFDENVWVEMARATCLNDMGERFHVVLTGVRFENELSMVQEEGGVNIWVERPGYGPVNGHASDNTLGPDDFDFVLLNDGTLQDLAGHAVALDALIEQGEDLVGPSLPKMRYSEHSIYRTDDE